MTTPMLPILYTTHCPKCRILEHKLKAAGVAYETCDDISQMTDAGIEEVPALKLPSGAVLSYYQAVKYLNSRQK